MLNSAHLLDQADHLLVAGPGGAQARLTDRCRAISATYYALFHTVLAAAADQSVGQTAQGTELYSLAYRSIEHMATKSLCETVQKQTSPAKYRRYTPAAGWAPEISGFAEVFITLNEQRMLADYDPMYTTTVAEAQNYVTVARNAIARFQAADPTMRKAFITLLLFPPR